MRAGLYPARVWAYDATTGIAKVSIRQLFGDQIVQVEPEVMRQADVADILPVINGDIILVFFEGADDSRLKWQPRVIDDAMTAFYDARYDARFDPRYVDITGDTMTGLLRVGAGATNVQLSTTGVVTATGPGDQFASAIVVPASAHGSSDRAGISLGDWQIAQDFSANGTKDLYFYNGAQRLLITPAGDATFLNNLFSQNGGLKLGSWPTNGAFNGVHHTGQYLIMSDGNDTFVSAPGSGRSVYIRAGQNNSGRELAINPSGSHTLTGALSCGDVAINSATLYLAGQGDANYRLLVSGGISHLVSFNQINLYMQTSGAVFQFFSSGNAFTPAIGGAAWVDNSSYKIKQDIRPADRQALLDQVMAIGVKNYRNREGNTATVYTGFIAELLHKVIPEVTTVGNEGEPNGIAYGRLTPHLVATAQLHEDRIVALERQLLELLASSN